jgi:hypothetical protein
MPADPLLAALDDALECPQARHLSRADRLALALWWLIECVADEFEMPPERAADEVAMLCGLAREMVENAHLHHNADQCLSD